MRLTSGLPLSPLAPRLTPSFRRGIVSGIGRRTTSITVTGGRLTGWLSCGVVCIFGWSFFCEASLSPTIIPVRGLALFCFSRNQTPAHYVCQSSKKQREETSGPSNLPFDFTRHRSTSNIVRICQEKPSSNHLLTKEDSCLFCPTKEITRPCLQKVTHSSSSSKVKFDFPIYLPIETKTKTKPWPKSSHPAICSGSAASRSSSSRSSSSRSSHLAAVEETEEDEKAAAVVAAEAEAETAGMAATLAAAAAMVVAVVPPAPSSRAASPVYATTLASSTAPPVPPTCSFTTRPFGRAMPTI